MTSDNSRTVAFSLIISIIYIIYFYIYYYRVTDFRTSSAVFRAFSCYPMPLYAICFANVTALSCPDEVMGGTLTELTELFLALLECKQIGTVYDCLATLSKSNIPPHFEPGVG